MFMTTPAGASSVSAVNLSGTSGSPNTSNDLRTTDPSGFTAVAGFRFNTDGTVDRWNNGTQSDWGGSQSPAEWYITQTTPPITYYGRLTLDSGTAADNNSSHDGASFAEIGGAVGVMRIEHTETVAAFGTFNQSGTYKVEIATDSGGTNIVATGYYKYNIAVGP